MTRKDYELIASAIHGQVTYWQHESKRQTASEEYRQLQEDNGEAALDIVISLATLLQADNPRFDRARFIKACGVEA